MKSKEIYQAIDLSKVGPELKTKLIALEKATNGFTNERADANMDMAMNKIYAVLKDKKPESLKNIEVKTVEVEEKVETIVEGKPVKKTTKTKKKVAGKKKKVAKKTATPSSGLKKPTVSSVASKIRKPNESWSDALSRAKVIFNEKKQTQVAKTKKAVDDLRDFLKDDKNFTGWPRTYGKEKASDNSLERDAQRQASPPGKRVSKTGRVYYENRDNRADREANSFPRKIFLKEGGDIMIEPTILQNNPNYLVGTETMYEMFDKGGYVAVSEKDGYWYIMSKPSSKEEAQEVIDMGVPRGEKGKVVTLEEAKAYNKVIGREYLEKGGKISASTTYVPNRSIKELSIMLGKSLKTLKGTDIVDGIYVKNDALKSTKKSSMNSVDGIFDDIVSMATLQGLEDDIKVVKKDDIQKLLDAGYDSEDIMVIYFGPSALTNVKIDISYSSGLFGYREDYIPTKIQNFVEAAKNKTYELGLKFPQFNWSDILKKYKIDKSGKDIDGKERTNKTSPALVRGANDKEYYVYKIYEGDKVVVGTVMDRVRIINGKKDDDDYYRRDPEDLKNFQGGYWGVVSSDKKIIKDIAKMILRKNTGYVKDMNIFVNGLGGVDAETLDKNKIPYELGGEVVIPTTYLDYNPDYLVGTNTMYEMFADGGSVEEKDSVYEIELFWKGLERPNRVIKKFYVSEHTLDEIEMRYKYDLEFDVEDEHDFEDVSDKISSFEEVEEFLKKDWENKTNTKFAKGGYVDVQANLMKELQKLQRELNSQRLMRYTEGDDSQEEMARKRERASKLARFNEILATLRELESKKMANGGMMARGGFVAIYNGKKINIEADSLYAAKLKAIEEFKVPKSKQGLLSVVSNKSLANQDFRFMANGGMMAKGGKISEFDDVLIISKNKLGMVEAIADNIYYITTPFGESFEAALDDLQKVKSFSKGGAMEHMILLGDKVLDIYKNVLIVQSVSGGVTVIDFRQEPIARRILVERITGKNTLASAKEFIDTDPSFNNYVSKEAIEIARLTATRPDAVQKFVDTHNLNIDKLYKFLKKENSKSTFGGFAMDFVTALVGRDGNPNQKKMIKMFQESVNQKMAMGGSLQGHGLEVGDLIVEDLGGYIKVMSEDGKEYFIKLRDGDRLTEPPLPFERGGEVKIGDIARLAAKYNKTGQEVTNAISKGADVEVEHTEDRKKAMRIAVDHLEEDFYYYTKLKAVEGEVDLTEFYEGGGNVPKVFDVPAQFLDSEGKRKNDRKTIKELTDFVLELPQTKEIYYNDELGDYTPSRKKLHAEIINKFKKEVVCINNDKPIAIFMGGSPASGKSSFLRKYSPFLLKEEILKIDADEIRAMLPEYEGWNATQTHLETKDIVNTLLSNKNIGIPCDFDIIYDGTMNSVKSYIPLMDILRKRGYKIFIVFMDNVPKDVIIKRALDRYKKSGRFVPLEVIEDFFSKGKTAFNELKKDVDGYMRIDGSSQDYKVLEEGGMKLPRDREYSKLGTKIKASDIPVSYKKGGLSKLY